MTTEKFITILDVFEALQQRLSLKWVASQQETQRTIARPSGEVVSGVRGCGDGDLASEIVGSSRRIITHGASGSGGEVQAVRQRREGCMNGLVPFDAHRGGCASGVGDPSTRLSP